MKFGFQRHRLLFPILLFCSFGAHSNIIINSTRVIYNENENEITLKLTNNGTMPALAQSWIDDGDANASPEKINVPFIITPPINRIDADKSQTLRISYTGVKAQSKREKIYWLNILDIPAAKNENLQNKLQIAYRTRLKLFYRPSSLSGGEGAAKAAEEIKWTINNGQLRANNKSPYYVSLVSVSIMNGTSSASVAGEMLAPDEEKNFKFNRTDLVKPGASINYAYVNDWGAVKQVSINI